MEGKDMNR